MNLIAAWHHIKTKDGAPLADALRDLSARAGVQEISNGRFHEWRRPDSPRAPSMRIARLMAEDVAPYAVQEALGLWQSDTVWTPSRRAALANLMYP